LLCSGPVVLPPGVPDGERGKHKGENLAGSLMFFLIMPRSRRVTPGGMVFHVLNRGVGRQPLFDKPGDFAALESIIEIIR